MQQKSIDDFDPTDFRRTVPKYVLHVLHISINSFGLLCCSRFSEENFPKILDIVSQLKEIGARHNATPGQATLAWLLAQGDDFFIIPGTKKIKASLLLR
jgi:aryl-alcohol dehydrogenase-like predicted oxidoreductase